MSKNQHVTPHPLGGWQVKGDNNAELQQEQEPRAKL